jgi:hypothetical protein
LRREHEENVNRVFLRFLALLNFLLFSMMVAQGAPQDGGDFSRNSEAKKLPAGVLLVKGAWSSASDAVTPRPEGGRVANNVYTNSYFGITYPLPADWIQKYDGPPPSDSGYYVLAQFRPGDSYKGTSRGSILIAAQDLFFSLTPTANALELLNYTNGHLGEDFKVERAPAPVSIADHVFVRLDYFSPVAGLHWDVLATQIRCHVIQFVFTSRDTKLLESLIQDMNKMKLPAEASPIAGNGGDGAPMCIPNFARDENVMEKVDPFFSERRFNPIPVRIIIDKDGKVKHIHFLSAFPEQAKAITDALLQWRFSPYLRDGKPVEVETGIMFGRAPRPATTGASSAVNE